MSRRRRPRHGSHQVPRKTAWLVAKIVYRWPYNEDPDFAGGWCVGVVESAVAVAGGVEFEVSYECDQTTATTRLTRFDYRRGDVVDAWMLLRPVQ